MQSNQYEAKQLVKTRPIYRFIIKKTPYLLTIDMKHTRFPSQQTLQMYKSHAAYYSRIFI